MKAFKVGDIVNVKGKICDIIFEAQYNPDQDYMQYSMCYSGAWYRNEDIKFVARDRLGALRRYCKTHDINTGELLEGEEE